MTTIATARREIVPSSVLGMLLLIGAEVMFFAGLISAFTIARAGAQPGRWTTAAAPLLPVTSTLANTTALIVSGMCVFMAHRRLRRQRPGAERLLALACILGALFVGLQGREWAALLSQGLTLQSGGLGAFFYLIVGAHAAHAVVAIVVLAVAWWRLRVGTLTDGFLFGTETFWYFVVALWPIIYLRVYF
jgi:cytochrome c oxidase subunit III